MRGQSKWWMGQLEGGIMKRPEIDGSEVMK